MNGFENEIYRYLLLVSNLVGLVMLFTAIQRPRVARLLFFALFAWACWMNWTTALEKPQVYLDYANFTWSRAYHDFIRGWFAHHIQPVVIFIAICQGLIAISLLLRGWLFKTGVFGAILFLLAIVPFGVGAGFPTTIIMAIALVIVLRKRTDDFIWRHRALVV